MKRFLLLGALGLALGAPTAHAQYAFPYGQLTQNRFGGTVQLGLPDGGTIFGARLGFGRPTFDASAGVSLFDGDGGFSQTAIGVATNYYATRESVQLPVTVRIGGELNFITAEDSDVNALNLVLGGGVSKRFTPSPTLAIIPDGFAGLLYTRISDDGGSNTDLGISLAGHFVLGATGRFAITPSVSYNGNDWTPGVSGTLLF